MQSHNSSNSAKLDVPQSMTATGSSMFPAIVKGDRLTFEVCKGPVVVGDIVLAILQNKQWVIHRVVGVSPIVTKGDANAWNDLNVMDVIAKVVNIERTGFSRLRRTKIWKKLSWHRT